MTVYIFDDLKYDKPFFSTYVKTTLFTSYLCGFAIYAPWRDECRRQREHHQLARFVKSDFQIKAVLNDCLYHKIGDFGNQSLKKNQLGKRQTSLIKKSSVFKMLGFNLFGVLNNMEYTDRYS